MTNVTARYFAPRYFYTQYHICFKHESMTASTTLKSNAGKVRVDNHTQCYHCSEPLPTTPIPFDEKSFCCELLSSFYDLWSLTSLTAIIRYSSVLWIAFKFLWSLVFDIRGKILTLSLYVVNCFQVFMIFGLWHRSHITLQEHISCELLSSFYDLWSLTSESNNVNRYN